MAMVSLALGREIDCFSKEINHLFDTVVPTFNVGEKGIVFTPAVEMEQNQNGIDLKLEIPGLEAKDLDIQVTAEAVAIKGERRQETQTEEQKMTRSEFRYGTFQRTISLPVRVQNDQVKANYKEGILHLHLPLAEAEKNKVVKVNID